MASLMELRNISLSYHEQTGETAVLSNISFQIDKGEFISIVGPSGCGKSTLLDLICGLLKPEEGDILFNRTYIPDPGTGIGYMLQKDHLLEWRTVWRNVVLGPELHHQATPQKKEELHRMLRTYGLEKFENAHPSQLSGGMRQRAALIRTLALEPDLLLLDEPFSALDYQTRLNVSNDIGSIIRKEGKTAILVTHDISEAISMADRVLILSRRPARLKQDIKIQMETPNRTPLSSRADPQFKHYFNLIWKELNSHEIDITGSGTLSQKKKA